jgi:hypothetical protein
MAALLLGAGSASADHKPPPPAMEPSDLKPAVRIEVGPLGYLPPSAFYLTYRLSSATVGFFDDDHLLFTFRVGGLLKRSPEDQTGDDDQEIRALVLDLKTRKVAKQAEWRMHDRAAYLWPYTDGRFLVRIRDSLFFTDQSLSLEPYLNLQDGLREVEISPDRKLTVLETAEPEKAHPAVSLMGAGETARPVKVIILPSGSRSAIAASDAQNAVLLPLMNDGTLDTLEGTKEASWVVRALPFHGAPKTIAEINSTCRPGAQPVSDTVALMMGCYFNGNDHQVVAISTDGQELWQSRWQNKYVWGWFDYAENGSRFAYESLEVTRPISTFDALYPEDVTAQLAGVYDTQTGKLVLVKDASPVLTAGQNVALSPDGKRFAILRDGALEVYDLPPVSEPAPQKPKSAKKKG